MIQSMYIRSGELVIILGVKKYFKRSRLGSLRFQFALLLILAGVIPVLIIEGVLLNTYEKRAVNVRTAEIQSQCTILCNQLGNTDYPKGKNSDIIQTELDQLTNIYNGRVMLIDENFQIVEDTYGMDDGKTIVSGDVIQCSQGRGTSHYDAENRYIEVTSPITYAQTDTVKGVMLVSVSTDTIVDTLHELKVSAQTVGGIILIIWILVSLVLSKLMVRPFVRITRSLENATAGYDESTLHENAYTETVQMTEAFNKMLERLRVLDDSRKEFVSNVSHELKTPLTSMKVLSDSLLAQEEVPVELYKEFMGDLSEEIERENKIINDLLSLVKMDKTADTLNISSVNINALVERILKQLRPIAAKRNIEVVFESFRPVTAEVDEVKLSLAITNLVENAIKYNHENGWVHVALNADHKLFYIEVADSGIGIAQEETDHIFERFYRVDKSHSREIGGTGLGLAIARSAIVMHRGAIRVYSQLGKGTTFTVKIPLTYVS